MLQEAEDCLGPSKPHLIPIASRLCWTDNTKKYTTSIEYLKKMVEKRNAPTVRALETLSSTLLRR